VGIVARVATEGSTKARAAASSRPPGHLPANLNLDRSVAFPFGKDLLKNLIQMSFFQIGTYFGKIQRI
jgi:hypothetical protein